MQCEFEIAGVDSFIIRLGSQPSERLIHGVGAVAQLIQRQFSHFIVDVIPSYTTVLVVYDIRQIRYQQLREQVQQCLIDTDMLSDAGVAEKARSVVRLPVCYDPSVGLDLQRLSDQLSLPIQDIIRRHSQVTYQVYAIGFSPGFGYLGQVDPLLQVPRLATPRKAVPAGSVAIAEAYSAVYPQQTPGGWWIIGRCPTPLFDPNRDPINLLSVGDNVVFEPIGLEAFHALQEAR